MLSQFDNFTELVSLLKYYYITKTKKETIIEDKTLKWCFDILVDVSRSFSTVIQELPKELSDVVCIFYLVLRGLDTIEDDEKLEEGRKLNYLLTFFNEIEENDNFSVKNVGKGPSKYLLEEFPKVIKIYKNLPEKYRKIVYDITKKMSLGMHSFITKDVNSIQDYNLYCHYVAGVVGQGLTRLFVEYKLKNLNDIDNDIDLSNQMGLFLQKVNIIRDFIQDIYEGKHFIKL
jgi:farnesyl-diphosphate farnesyltransferase